MKGSRGLIGLEMSSGDNRQTDWQFALGFVLDSGQGDRWPFSGETGD